MASQSKTDSLQSALLMIKEGEMSLRDVSQHYGIPKSTLHDHYSGKVKGFKRGPPTVLSEAEETMLAEWAINMSNIGYGRTREQLLEIVKTMDKDGRRTQFVDNRPG